MQEIEDIKMPKLLRDFLFIGIGLTGFHLAFHNVDIHEIKNDIFMIFVAAILTAIFSYGLISVIKDFREGGGKVIVSNIKRYWELYLFISVMSGGLIYIFLTYGF